MNASGASAHVHERFGKPEIYLKPGDFHSSSEDIVISTLLGSCVAVVLFDVSIPIGGMNHFMLPSSKIRDDPLFSETGKYGINAMELLINDILKKGGKKKSLRAKVFGGSTMMNLDHQATYDIPKMNIEFAFRFLENERIPIESYSIGGNSPRLVHFFVWDARVLMKNSVASPNGIARTESAYSHKLLEKAAKAGRPILF
jgi:chemotaxis protein CheD